MYKRYYDGYCSQPRKTSYNEEIIVPETECKVEEKNDCCECSCTSPQSSSCTSGGVNILGNSFDIEDIILIGVLLMVMKESADDTMLIVILAVIFLSGLKDK